MFMYKIRGNFSKWTIVLLFLMLLPAFVKGQTKKILIVPMADTSLVTCRVGLTVFSNKADSLPLDLALGKFIENKLVNYLTGTYSVSIEYPPAEIAKKPYGAFGKTKEFKKWLEDHQAGTDVVILIHNIDIRNILMDAPIPNSTSGFYSRGRSHGVFTSISFQAYTTHNNRVLEYYEQNKAFVNLKDFKMPKDKGDFDQASLEVIRSEMCKLQDNRIKYFLSKTYLMPELDHQTN